MAITEDFVAEVLKNYFAENFQYIYDHSLLLQYLDKKVGAIHADSKKRRSLANIYAIYSILHYYSQEFYNKLNEYRQFEGYDYMKLFHFYRSLYGGNKLQNHALNSRVNGEFRNRFPDIKNNLIITNSGKYLIHLDYLYVNNVDISRAAMSIIEQYIQILKDKDKDLSELLNKLTQLNNNEEKREQILKLLSANTEARIFEIISYAILKNHYKNIKVYFGYSLDGIKEEHLELYKTGRTNANDGGIDFVMRPVGRFFQVTEVNNYDKYLLDIDKVMHFPISFVVKTDKTSQHVLSDIDLYIKERANGMVVVEKRYKQAIEEIITINELRLWISEVSDTDIDNILRDIDIYYRLELNID